MGVELHRLTVDKGRRRAVLFGNDKGQAFVEAAILFPIMIMIFAALVLLSIYLPTRGALQRATQNAATTIATIKSDTWLFFDESTMTFYWERNKDNLKNVYAAIFSDITDVQSLGEEIVASVEARNLSAKAGTLTVESVVIDRILYKEVIVTANREIPIPVNLSFVGFPQTIPIIVTSSASVQSGGEFVRTIDMAVDFGQFLLEKFGITDIAGNISSSGQRIRTLLGW